MSNSFGKIVSIFLCVLILFLYPLISISQKADAITQTIVLTETTNFVDAIKNNGYLSKSMYLEYIRKLDATGNLYDIRIEHAHQIVNPIYDESSTIFQDDFSVHYYNTYEDDILKQLFDEDKMYYFNQGDYISLCVSNRTKTLATRIYESVLEHEIGTKQIIVTYGGMIRDENY